MINYRELKGVVICEENDLLGLYKNYVEDELSSDDIDMYKAILSYDDFIREYNKGYGNNDCVEVARLYVLDGYVMYDLEYCG